MSSEAKTLDVAPYLLDADAGDGGIHVALAVLQALERKTSYATLKAVSGDGFKFVYDRGEVFEAMRDLSPTDFLRSVFALYKVKGAWHTNYALEELDTVLAQAIDAGWPVVTSNVLDTFTGYQIIFGIDRQDDVPRIALRGGLLSDDLETDASPKRPARWVPVDADWDGPVTSRARWGVNPVFIIEEVGAKKSPKNDDLLATAAEEGMRTYEAFELAYSTSGVDEAFAREPLAGRLAASGAEAWAVLLDEIKTRPPLQSSAFIWKINATMRRLAHDRRALAEFFQTHAKRVKTKGLKAQLSSLVETLNAIAGRADALRELVWHTATQSAATTDDIQSVLTSTRAVAYALPENETLHDELRAVGYDDRIFATQHGTAVIMDDDMRWFEVRKIVRELADIEADVEAALPRIASIAHND